MPSEPDLPPVGRPLLLNLSGGIDSTYAMWALLNAGHRLVVHHVELKTRERRWEQEGVAVAAICDWHRQHGLSRFEYVQTGLDYSNVNHLVRDIELVRFMSGVVLRNHRWRHVDRVVASGIAEDPQLGTAEVARIRRLLEDAANRRLELVRPIRHMPKRDVIAAMPDGLYELAWYCRKPRNGQVCGTCRTCRHVKKAGA